MNEKQFAIRQVIETGKQSTVISGVSFYLLDFIFN